MLMHKVGGMSTGDPYGIEIHLVDPVHFSRAKLEKPPAALSNSDATDKHNGQTQVLNMLIFSEIRVLG
jgi:hypothetical protein